MYISPFVEERGPPTTSVDIEIHSAPEKIESSYENTISDKLGIHVYLGQNSRLQHGLISSKAKKRVQLRN